MRCGSDEDCRQSGSASHRRANHFPEKPARSISVPALNRSVRGAKHEDLALTP
jgi:hypothetical protein